MIFYEGTTRSVAFYLWKEAGRPEGDGDHYWFEAEKLLTNLEGNFALCAKCMRPINLLIDNALFCCAPHYGVI